MTVKWGSNFDDDLAGAPEHAVADPNLAGLEDRVKMEFEQVFMFYLPRICEHCLNPSCVASCPSGAMYKREEDGIVLVDQDRCRGWRFCVSGCPYKKVYFNHRTGKAEKCTFCFPRIEAGQPTICSETCVGRLRYLGLILYDANKVLGAAATPGEQDLYQAQLDVFLDPHDPGVRGGIADGRPALSRDIHLAEAILALSGTTNGEVAMQGWRALEERTGVRLSDLAEERAGERISFADTQVQPRAVITSPEWSGSETGGRRYSPFVVNVERKKPWHTLTGRMHFFLDHDWIAEYGEWLPAYRPPLDYVRHFGEQGLGEEGRPEITVRYLTPHSKWSIHSEYADNLHMLRLFRGGPVIWMSPGDAAKVVMEPGTTGSRRITATASWSAGPWSPTGCPRAPCSCTTRRTVT